MRFFSRFAGVVLLGLCLQPSVGAAMAGGDDIAVKVDIQGEVVQVDVELVIPATPREVWEVLTDFDHLPRFITNIKSSRVISRDGNVVRVAQTGKTSFGPLTFEFQSERELTLSPYDGFESRMISGNMKRFHGSTWLEAVDGKTRIHYHSEAVPDTVVPLGLGRSLIESETREHYQDIRREVLRRKSTATAPAP
jgi:carbon monoxide dehydrogenase subunit G